MDVASPRTHKPKIVNESLHIVSLKSHGPVLWSMKLLPFLVNQNCFPSALYKFNKTELRHMEPAVTSTANWGGGGVGFMHSVSLKYHGPVLWPMKLLPFPLNQSCFPSALYKFNKTELRHMVPAVTSVVIDSKALFLKTRK